MESLCISVQSHNFVANKRKSLDQNTPMVNTSFSQEDIDHKVKRNLQETSVVNLISSSQHEGDQKRNVGKDIIDDILSRQEKIEREVQDLKNMVKDLMNRFGQNGGASDDGRKFFSSPTLNKKKVPRPNVETIKVPDGFLLQRMLKKDVASKKDEKTIPAWLSVMFATKQTLNLTPDECAVASYVFGSPTNKKFDEEELLVQPEIKHCVGKRNLFQCLKPIQMLDMDIIDLYASMLTFNEKKDRSNVKYWFLPTVFSQFVQARQLSTKALRLSYKDIFMGKVDKVSKIFIPVHDSDSMHWFLLVIDIVNKKLIYLDSLPSDSAYARRKISIKNLRI